jgi:hypothetical protein
VESAGYHSSDAGDGGMSQKASDFYCVPLCSDCHTMSATAYHRIGQAAFEKLHKLNFRALVKRLNREWRNLADVCKKRVSSRR